MKAEHLKVVSVSYVLTVAQNNEDVVVERTEEDRPMVFLFGASGLPPKFESELEGKSIGDSFKFTLSPVDGFGDYLEEAISEIPKEVFVDENNTFQADHVIVGEYLELVDEEGYHHRGKVLSVGEEMVKIDFNHPLAGVPVTFDGSILAIRDADPSELAHGHVHGEGGHHH